MTETYVNLTKVPSWKFAAQALSSGALRGLIGSVTHRLAGQLKFIAIEFQGKRTRHALTLGKNVVYVFEA